MTNREKLAAMSNEELAEWIFHMPGDACDVCKYSGRCNENKSDCEDGIKEWLEEGGIRND